MPASDATTFRSQAARINYIAQDRPDLSLAACVLATRMAAPRLGDETLVKKLVRYLRNFPEMVLEFAWQEGGGDLVATTDSDWATCPLTRISKSGGTVAKGVHTLHHWCKQQDRVALSSGEAELKACCKAMAELLEISAVVGFMTNCAQNLRLALDAQATEGMLLRQGRGKLKHLSVKSLWVQQAITDCRVEVLKIPRTVNHADALCSMHSTAEFHAKMAAMGLRLSTVLTHGWRGRWTRDSGDTGT